MFGGAKTPQEEITNELWSFDLRNLVWTCLLDDTGTPSNDTTNATTSLVQGGGSTSVSMATGRAGRSAGGDYLPMPVRSHTAHIVGSKMVVLFGYSNREDVFISYVQEYDIGKSGSTAYYPYCQLLVMIVDLSTRLSSTQLHCRDGFDASPKAY